MDLSKLSEPFPGEDIEWRVSRSGRNSGGIFCLVLAYITARAIQKRLDDVCGPENWRLETPLIIEINGKSAFAVGISIFTSNGWVTKWDVAEPTAERGSISAPAKGGFSGAMKRAGAQWGIGRYLYALDETFAEVSEHGVRGDKTWNYAKLPKDEGGTVFYWKTPTLPAWALPKEPEHEVSDADLNELKKAWKEKFAPNSRNPKELREGFQRFVYSCCGEFPISDSTCWVRDAFDKCTKRISNTDDPQGIAPDVPFEN